MDLMFLLVSVLGLAVLASPVGLALLAMRLRRVERELAELRGAWASQPVGPRSERHGSAGEQGTAQAVETDSEMATPAEPAAGPRATPWSPAQPPRPSVPPELQPIAPSIATPAVPRPEAPWNGIEEALTSRLMVWVGGVAVALAALFLYRIGVEEGWLGPWTRVLLGLALGVALILAGDWAERTRPALARAMPPDAAGPALTAAGLFALYVSLYAAHALWALIGAPVAFAALAAVSFAAIGLARRQGWFVALLGLGAGYLVPALLRSATPAPVPVFLFLFALSAGCLALLTVRRWWFLALLVPVGAVGWPLVWLFRVGAEGDQGVVGLYLLGIAALFGLFGTDLPVKRPEEPARAWIVALVSHSSGWGFLASGVMLTMSALVYDYNRVAMLLLGGYAALGLGLGRRHRAFESLAVAAALVVAAALLLWPEPIFVTSGEELARRGISQGMAGFGPFLLPPELRGFAWSLAGFAALFGLGGFAALRRAPTPGLWAGLSASMPVLMLALGYWRIGGLAVDLGWAGLAAGLSLACFGAATVSARMLPAEARESPVALYAAASTAALAIGFGAVLRRAWLTIALAIEMLALAWIWRRWPIEALRTIAFGLIAVVVVRLTVNPALLDYQGFGWALYAYGLPAACFIAAARLWRQGAGDPLADLCEIAAAGFLLLLGALQLRLWTAGAIDAASYGLTDMAAQSLWWLAAAALLLRADLAPRLPWAPTVGRGLLVLAMVQLVVGHLGFANPLGTGEPVGTLPLLNLLGAAYLAPAALLGLIAARGDQLGPRLRAAVGATAGLLGFAWVTLEVRRAFHGSVLLLGPETRPEAAEIYSYSAVWLAFALALLAIGIVGRSRVWRAFALAVLVAAVAKVFLYDMRDLGGLLRVLSFLGLGLALIGIGRIYRRFVFA